MKRFCLYVIAVSLVMAVSGSSAEAITYYGSNGLLRVSSADNVYQGALWGTFNFSYNQGGYTGGSYRNGRGAINLLYGIRNYVEIGLSQVFYQDTAIFGGGPGSGPLRISVKGSIPRSTPSSFNVGAQIIGLLPVGSVSNAEHESYSSDQPSIGGMLVVSYDTNPYDFGRSKRFHFNLGYMLHNDINSYHPHDNFGTDLIISKSEDHLQPLFHEATKQVFFGAAVQVPVTRNNSVFAEVSGEHFLSINPWLILTRDRDNAPAYVRFTPGFRTQLHNRFVIQAGVDFYTFAANFEANGANVSVYPRWKIFAGVQYLIREGIPPSYRRGRSVRMLGGSYYGFGRSGTTDKHGMGSGVIENLDERQELLDQVERDLQEIREERLEAQRELEELRRAIEEEEPDMQ